MTFEEAWPHIKEGKYFKIKFDGCDWGHEYWFESDLSNITLGLLTKAEFDFKRVPREYQIRFGKDGSRDVFQARDQFRVNPGDEVIKVREVVE